MTPVCGHVDIALPDSIPPSLFQTAPIFFSGNPFLLYLWSCGLGGTDLPLSVGVRVYPRDLCGWLRHWCSLIQVEVWEVMTLGDSGRDASSFSRRATRSNTFSPATCEPVSAEPWELSVICPSSNGTKQAQEKAEWRPQRAGSLVIEVSAESSPVTWAQHGFLELGGAA